MAMSEAQQRQRDAWKESTHRMLLTDQRRKARAKVSTEQKIDIGRRRKEGESVKALALEFELSASYIRTIAYTYG
jgi:hypothetical protein